MDQFIAHWGYLAVFTLTFISAMGPPVGSEVAIGYGGALASGQLNTGHAHVVLVWIIATAVCGEFLGSAAGYAIGRFGGRAFVDRFGKFLLLTHRDLDRAEAFFAKRGDLTVFFGRCIPLIRSFVSFAAGVGEMAPLRFAGLSAFGIVLYSAGLSSIGYGLGKTWHQVLKNFSYASYAAAAIVVVVLVAGFAHRIKVIREERSHHAETEVPAAD